MNSFMLPPTGFGPGSQTLGEEETLEYMPLPQDMHTYAPHLPEIDVPSDRVAPALDLLAAVGRACDAAAHGAGGAEFDLAHLDALNLALIAETLGEGEVAARVRGLPALAVQESVFAGVWRVRGAGVDRIDVAPVPACVRRTDLAPRRASLPEGAALTPGVVNAPPLLAELRDKSAAWRPGAPLHVINLTLLPHTEEDLVWLDRALGEGAVSVLSRGYGNCRVTATALAHVWRVQFYNSMDTLILDTFEVTDIPEVILAAAEDLTDSAARIRAVLEAIA